MSVVTQQKTELAAPQAAEEPPPLMFVSEASAPAPSSGGRQDRELWARIGSVLTMIAVLTSVAVLFLALGFAFAKAVLGA